MFYRTIFWVIQNCISFAVSCTDLDCWIKPGILSSRKQQVLIPSGKRYLLYCTETLQKTCLLVLFPMDVCVNVGKIRCKGNVSGY